MKRKLLFTIALALVACQDTRTIPFEVGSFDVRLLGGQSIGTAEQPLPFSNNSTDVSVDIFARRDDAPNQLDRQFSGWVVLDVRPSGLIDPATRVTKLENGEARNVTVRFKQAYGTVRIVASEEGYVPRLTDPGNAACINGIDDDGDGFVDFPGTGGGANSTAGDRGCFAANDDDESGGTGASGASGPIFFANPRISDVQAPIQAGGDDESPLFGTRVTIDRGFMLVTRVGVDGMYLTDFDGVKYQGNNFVIDPLGLSYRSVFAFNFSTPANLYEGDCLVQLDGSVDEFFGYTEIGKPTWKKGDAAYCGQLAANTGLSLCAAPANEGANARAARERACRLAIEGLANTPVELTRMVIDDGTKRSLWDNRLRDAERFESALIQLSSCSADTDCTDGGTCNRATGRCSTAAKNPVRIFTELRVCDSNGDGIVDFSIKAESDCSNDCGDDPRCVVAETYRRFGQWTVHFVDGTDQLREVSVTTTGSAPNFDPTAAKGREIGKLVGTMRHLNFGRPAWIVEPRRSSDCADCKIQ